MISREMSCRVSHVKEREVGKALVRSPSFTCPASSTSVQTLDPELCLGAPSAVRVGFVKVASLTL